MIAVLVTADVAAGGLLVHLDHRIAGRVARWDLRDKSRARALLTVLVYFGQRGVVLTASAVVLGWVSWRQRSVEPLVRLAVALVLVFTVVYAFKVGLGRNAPRDDQLGRPAGSGSSYPSGHIANAIVFWGLIEWSVRHWPSPNWVQATLRTVRWVAPVAIFVGMTLLNYHWLTDFVGGAAIAVVLLAITVLPMWTNVAGPADAFLRRPATNGS